MFEVKLILADFREYDNRVNVLISEGWELDGQPIVVNKPCGDPKAVVQRLLRRKSPVKKNNV